MADDPTPESPAFSESQMQSLQKVVSQLLNSALSQRDKTAEKKAREQHEGFARLLDEKLSTLKPTEPTEPTDGGKGKGRQADTELSNMRRQLADLEKMARDNAAMAASERAKNRESMRAQRVAEALEPHGITGMRFKAAYALLRDRVEFADDDSDDLLFVEDSTSRPDLGTGLSSWIKSDEAKLYIPPTGTQGAGTRPPKQGTRPAGPVTADERNNRISAALSAWAEGSR